LEKSVKSVGKGGGGGDLLLSVAEPHSFYAAPAPGEDFDAAPAPTLLHSKAKFLKRTKD
jgi:hypothetical protein